MITLCDMLERALIYFCKVNHDDGDHIIVDLIFYKAKDFQIHLLLVLFG
jgi:hypothetical protein